MTILCVEDALPILEDTEAMCQRLSPVPSVQGFTRPREALAWLEKNPADVALLDIDLPEMSGLMLAEKIKRLRPEIAIIFLTAFPQYAVQAFKLRASGYLLKPVSMEDLRQEVAYALSRRPERPEGHIAVQTFGDFEIFVDGETLAFERAKSKELLAYLVDRGGQGVTRADIFAALFEDELYDRSHQKYLDVIMRSLRKTLRQAGIEEILEVKSGFVRIRPEMLNCDLYRFLKKDPVAVNAYRGEYMRSYEWAMFDPAVPPAIKP